jgi:hypothetical protein
MNSLNASASVTYSACPVPGYSISDGWLLYVGRLGGKDVTVVGDVSHVEITIASGGFPYTQNNMYVNATMIPAGQGALLWDTTDSDDSAGRALWERVRDWTDRRKERKVPVELQALLDLARRHQAEYDDLREKLAILRALGG